MYLRTPRDVGLAIRERRRSLGLDQRTLARRVGVGRQWIVEAEKGKRRAELGLILRTLEALGLTVRAEPALVGVPAVCEAVAATVSIDAVVAAHRRRPGETS
jgi:HTH-type transcriptional regulator/antitoxin HipB